MRTTLYCAQESGGQTMAENGQAAPVGSPRRLSTMSPQAETPLPMTAPQTWRWDMVRDFKTGRIDWAAIRHLSTLCGYQRVSSTDPRIRPSCSIATATPARRCHRFLMARHLAARSGRCRAETGRSLAPPGCAALSGTGVVAPQIRMKQPPVTIYTIGFTQKKAAEFFGLLREHGITKVQHASPPASPQPLRALTWPGCGASWTVNIHRYAGAELLDRYRGRGPKSPKTTWRGYAG